MLLAHLWWLGSALWREMCLKACSRLSWGDSRSCHLAPYVHRTNFTVNEAKDPPNTGTERLYFTLCIYENDRLAFALIFTLLPLLGRDQLALDWNGKEIVDLFFTPAFTWISQEFGSGFKTAIIRRLFWANKLLLNNLESKIGHAVAQLHFIWFF